MRAPTLAALLTVLLALAPHANGSGSPAPASVGVELVPSTGLSVPTPLSITTSGTLTSDETWSGTVTLTGDVTVPSGITLTIQPGTIVQATALSDDRSGGADPHKIELIVGGRLGAQGTDANPIRFTSTAAMPAKSDWYGIRYVDGADNTVTLSHLVVEWAFRGISNLDNNAYPDVADSTFRHLGSEGIRLSAGMTSAYESEKPVMTVSGNRFEDVGAAIYMWVGTSPISFQSMSWQYLNNGVNGCTLSNAAISVKASKVNGVVRISGNSIASCPGDGISFAGSTSTIASAELDDNTITGGNAAIRVASSTKVTSGFVRRNTFSGAAYGVYTYDSSANLRVEGNTGTGPGTTGTGITLYAGQSIRNEMHHYGTGIYAGRSNGVSPVVLWNWLHDDGICASGDGAFVAFSRMESCTQWYGSAILSNGLDMRRNYWGDTTTVEMNSRGYPANISTLHDAEDCSSCGRLDYEDWLLAPDPWPSAPSCRFVWPVPGTATSFSENVLEGAAYAPAGVGLVEVSTDGGASWTPAAGTDHWALGFTPASTGTYDLRCRTTGLDGAQDPNPSVSSLQVDDSLWTTAGTLLGDETWTGTVTLEGDVRVPAGRTLTLAPGTIVHPPPIADRTHSGADPTRTEIVVEGDLVSAGTPDAPVSFTPSYTVPAPKRWTGLRYLGSTGTSPLSNVVIEWADTAVYAARLEAWPDITDSTIRHTSSRAVYLALGTPTGGPSRSVYQWSRTTFEDVAGGVFVALGAPTPAWESVAFEAIGNTVTCASGQYNSGLEISATTAVHSLRIANNQVTSCGQTGIFMYGFDPGTSRYGASLMEDNVVTSCGTGVAVASPGGDPAATVARRNTVSGGMRGGQASGSVTVDGNRFLGGSTDGLDLYNSCVATRNEVTGYAQAGAGIGGTTAVLLYNNIHDNGGWGIDGHGGTARWNRIETNATGAARANAVNPGAPVDLRRNWWGPTMTAEIDAAGYPANLSSIYDIEDDAQRGRVDYSMRLGGLEPVPEVTESRFVWPASGSLLPRAPITVEGTAWSPDGVAAVEVSSDDGVTWFPATGTSVWRFTFDPPSSSTFTLLCRARDLNGVVESTPDTVTFTADDSVTRTSGTLASDETWSGTVQLTGDVTVPAGRTLTILPGTLIKAPCLADDTRGGLDGSRTEIIVAGRLVANGGSGGRIAFTVATSAPSRGQWYGLRFVEQGATSEGIRGVDVSWAVNGFSLESTTTSSHYPDLFDCTVDQVSGRGVSVKLGGNLNRPQWTLSGCTLGNSTSYAVWIDWVNAASPIAALIEGNTISTAGTYALRLSSGYAVPLQATIRGNSVTCAGPCITLGSMLVLTPLVVENNTVTSSAVGDVSLLISPAVQAVVRDNTLTGGSYGLKVEDTANDAADVEIASNRISGALTAGLRLALSQGTPLRLLVHDNSIRDNTGDGIVVDGWVGRFYRNNLFGSTGYDFRNNTSRAIDASNHYWGPTTTTEMQSKGCDANISKISDQRDYSFYGLVTYCPFSVGAFGDQAVISAAETPTGYEWRWLPKPATMYDLIRGTLGQLSSSGGVTHLGTVACEAQEVAQSPIPDSSPLPPAGTGWFFLLRDHTSAGAYGYASDDSPELPDSGGCP